MSDPKKMGRPRVSPEKRFWVKVKRGSTAECWEWQACSDRQGYGWFSAGGRGGKQVMAHRFSYIQDRGLTFEDIDGMVIRHKCDNPPCVNPAHLEVGTQKENIRDALEQGHIYRQFQLNGTCWRGHPLTVENVGVNKAGARFCRECKRNQVRRWRQRNIHKINEETA